MKKLIVLCLFVLNSGLSFANDGGMAYIDVKGIEPTNQAQDGTQISFYGNDAANFMRLLPGYSDILYYLVSDNVAQQMKNNERGVAMVSNGWTLSFQCNAGKINYNSENPKLSQFFSKEPKCTISLYKNSTGGKQTAMEMLGDSWSMEPRNYENMCK